MLTVLYEMAPFVNQCCVHDKVNPRYEGAEITAILA